MQGLSKNPSEYPDASSLPHVAVATQMLNNGTIVRVGDHIPYVICKADGKVLTD
jgi:DNA polymerase alpha subunit A